VSPASRRARCELTADVEPISRRLDRLRPRRRDRDALERHLAKLRRSLEAFEARIGSLEERSQRLERTVEGELRGILRAIVAEDAANRRRLAVLRSSADYEAPLKDRDPLVSVIVPTYERAELLRTRSLPSLLAQTHENLEVLVVGDHTSAATRDAIAELNDDRISFTNLTQRYLAEENPGRQWFAGATMTRNEGLRRASGSWIAALDDDDHLYPNAIGDLLTRAREERLEVCYGRYRTLLRDGSSFESGDFPPRPDEFAWAAAICHAGLRFFERELVAIELGVPGDWYLLDRMLRAGVRFGFLPELLLDYHPSRA
jgi:Glycosyl transferase family 2